MANHSGASALVLLLLTSCDAGSLVGGARTHEDLLIYTPAVDGAGGWAGGNALDGSTSASTKDGATGGDGGAVPSPDGGIAPDQKTAPDQGSGGTTALDVLKGYWVWEKRVEGTQVQGPDAVDKGQMKIAFGTGNDKCHYIWNEITGSDFHTECTYTVVGDLATLKAKTTAAGKATGFSCAHPTWTNWNANRPAVLYSRYKFVGDRLWMGVNTYWGFGGGVNGVPVNNSLKRFPFWESKNQARTLESWIVFEPVTRAEWYGKYAKSANCQGTATVCANLPGCGAGDKAYVD